MDQQLETYIIRCREDSLKKLEHTYLNRCTYLLKQKQALSDIIICYYDTLIRKARYAIENQMDTNQIDNNMNMDMNINMNNIEENTANMMPSLEADIDDLNIKCEANNSEMDNASIAMTPSNQCQNISDIITVSELPNDKSKRKKKQKKQKTQKKQKPARKTSNLNINNKTKRNKSKKSNKSNQPTRRRSPRLKEKKDKCSNNNMEMIQNIQNKTANKSKKQKKSKQNKRKKKRVKSKSKQYQCPDCVYDTDKKQHFIYHQRTHSGLKPFECDICRKRFPRKDCLQRHKRSKYQCEPQ